MRLMPLYTLRWRTLDAPAVFQRLQEQRIDPDFHDSTHAGDKGMEVYFKVEADDEPSALEEGPRDPARRWGRQRPPARS
jgi:hypothetical protein